MTLRVWEIQSRGHLRETRKATINASWQQSRLDRTHTTAARIIRRRVLVPRAHRGHGHTSHQSQRFHLPFTTNTNTPCSRHCKLNRFGVAAPSARLELHSLCVDKGTWSLPLVLRNVEGDKSHQMYYQLRSIYRRDYKKRDGTHGRSVLDSQISDRKEDVTMTSS